MSKNNQSSHKKETEEGYGSVYLTPARLAADCLGKGRI